MTLPRRVGFPERSQRESNVPLSDTAFFRWRCLMNASERRRIPQPDNTRSFSVLEGVIFSKEEKPEASMAQPRHETLR
jgi:hypothetical protein